MFEEQGRVVRLDDVEYVVIGRIDDDIDTFVYLMSISSPLNIIIAKEKENNSSVVELVLVQDETEKMRIYTLFLQKARLGLL